MKNIFVLFILTFFPLMAEAGSWSISPVRIEPGGVGVIRWQGSFPAFSLASHGGEVIYLNNVGSGAWGLIGIDVEAAAGGHTVKLVMVDDLGQSTFDQLTFSVIPFLSTVPPEHLKLPASQVSPRRPEVLQRIRKEREMLEELFAGSRTPIMWNRFSLPVDGSVSTPFGRQRILNGKTSTLHSGIDFRGAAGTPVHTAGRGQVVFADDLFYTGSTVIIDHGEGLFTIYGHLRDILCRPGEILEHKAILGTIGSSGRSTGPHLHWSMNLRGARINPMGVIALFKE
ncbi:MAG: M23 family metallopeptidase [Candidatus Zixiibacteriota bacterium]|nr:MAG: M23 family metallopeptidase [candidate division Zixibacteria bacterium]